MSRTLMNTTSTGLALTQQGTLYTLGYANPLTEARIAELMEQHARLLLVDIRYTPVCSWSDTWNREPLATTYGKRYGWDKRLGNVHHGHRERGILLAPGHEQAVAAASSLLSRGDCLILLCACNQDAQCHRTLVAKLIQDELAHRSDRSRVDVLAREERQACR